jgi:hypothetical protein
VAFARSNPIRPVLKAAGLGPEANLLVLPNKANLGLRGRFRSSRGLAPEGSQL